jgi:arginine repressor
MAETIKDLIRLLADTGDIKYCVPATVLSVDKTNNTVDVEPLDGTAELIEIRLQAQAGKGIVCYPKIGSTVIVSFLNKDDGYVSMFSAIDTLSIENENTTLKEILKTLSKAVQNIIVTTPAGPSKQVVNIQDFLKVDNLIDTLFSH